MAVRRWRAHPDQQIVIDGELVPVVSREAIVQAIMDGEAIGAQMGGILVVMWGRQKTDFPGEAVTTGLVCEWKSGVRAADEPEGDIDVLPPPQPQPEPEPVEEPLPPAASGEPDGLDPLTLEEEDVSSIPESVR